MENFEIKKHITINGYDIDITGAVSNLVYIRWLENLRFAFLAQCLPNQKHIIPVILLTHVEQKLPLKKQDNPFGFISMDVLDDENWQMNYTIKSTSGVHCVAHQQGFFIDCGTKEKLPISTSLKNMLHD